MRKNFGEEKLILFPWKAFKMQSQNSVTLKFSQTNNSEVQWKIKHQKIQMSTQIFFTSEWVIKLVNPSVFLMDFMIIQLQLNRSNLLLVWISKWLKDLSFIYYI